ncbi:MAG: tetratricopeptide repeat protein [Phycisphaerales bacterium]|nr:tetratricopeptide repeat protein [Phycisphaerales bacterium]MCB9862758.1 tetratricopeptide repeat protein [Phycisphaerales bacterium]
MKPSERLEQALDAFRSDDFELALSEVDAMIAAGEDGELILAIKGQCLLELEQYEWAIETYESLLRRFPRSVSGLTGAGRCWWELGDFARARDLFRLAIEERPTAHRYVFLGDALRELGVYDEAIASCRAALDIEPDYEEAYFNLALIHAESNPDEAIRCLWRAVEIDPKYVDAHRLLGQLLCDAGHTAEGESHLGHADEFEADES